MHFFQIEVSKLLVPLYFSSKKIADMRIRLPAIIHNSSSKNTLPYLCASSTAKLLLASFTSTCNSVVS